jgi:hypothetical protein
MSTIRLTRARSPSSRNKIASRGNTADWHDFQRRGEVFESVRQGIGMHQSHVPGLSELCLQRRVPAGVKFDGDQLARAVSQQPRQDTPAGADLHHAILARHVGQSHDLFRDTAIRQKTLTQRLAWAKRGGHRS